MNGRMIPPRPIDRQMRDSSAPRRGRSPADALEREAGISAGMIQRIEMIAGKGLRSGRGFARCITSACLSVGYSTGEHRGEWIAKYFGRTFHWRMENTW